MKIKKYNDMNENKYQTLIRKDGFYWVLVKDDIEWTIGKYNHINNDGNKKTHNWEVVASDESFDENSFLEIGEFIGPIRKVLKNIWKD